MRLWQRGRAGLKVALIWGVAYTVISRGALAAGGLGGQTPSPVTVALDYHCPRSDHPYPDFQ
jgi:hypothetical protein